MQRFATLTRAAFLLSALLLHGAASAEGFQGTRSLSFDSGYVPSLTSNRAFWQFGIEFEGASSLVFDGLDQVGLGSSLLTRSGLLLGTYLFWPLVQESYFVANHELGHGSRMVAMGLEPYYVWRSKGTANRNIFSFFIQGLGAGSAAYANADAGNLSVTPPDNWSASITAGGMNNSAMFAEALEDHVLLGDGHIMEYIAYTRAKEDAANYVQNSESGDTGGTDESNDVKNILSHYAGRGFNITGSNIEAGSLLSRWLSATHWSYVIGAVRYVVVGNPSVPQPVIGSLKLPDFSHYLMYEGLSLKVRTAIVATTAQFPLEVEYVYKGDAVLEVSAGYRGLRELARGRKGVNSLQLYANSKGAFGAKAQRDSPLGERLVGSLGASVYQSNLLEGQRNIARFASTNLGYEAWGRLSWIY
jgi:hypothetical protein